MSVRYMFISAGEVGWDLEGVLVRVGVGGVGSQEGYYTHCRIWWSAERSRRGCWCWFGRSRRDWWGRVVVAGGGEGGGGVRRDITLTVVFDDRLSVPVGAVDVGLVGLGGIGGVGSLWRGGGGGGGGESGGILYSLSYLMIGWAFPSGLLMLVWYIPSVLSATSA